MRPTAYASRRRRAFGTVTALPWRQAAGGRARRL